jgi:hypothetical protein
MAICSNVGVPLGFSIGVAENMELYQQQYTAFAELFAIDLRQYAVESNQGSAFRALCTRNGQTELICLPHFSLFKTQGIQCSCRELGKMSAESEFETLKTLYEGEFRGVTDQKPYGFLLRTLKKAGLTFVDGTILIVDEQRWNVISMWKRVSTRMPSTTNSIEATHVHLNEAISRRNPFWPHWGFSIMPLQIRPCILIWPSPTIFVEL